MKISLPLIVLYLATLLGGIWYIQSTSAQLPEVVASHFNAAGVANGFSNRHTYTQLMVLITLIIPSLLVFSMTVLPVRSPDNINLPNRDYWLAPARRDASLRFLAMHGTVLGCALILFLCAVHWQVVQANSEMPVRLHGDQFFPLLMGFTGFVGVWTALLPWRFRKP